MTDFASSLSFPKLDTHPNFPSLPHPSQIDNSAVSLGHFKVGESVYLPIKMLAPYHESAVPTLGSSPPEEDPAVIAAEEAASATPSEGEEGMSGGPASEEGSLEAEAAELSPEQVRQVQAAEAAASEGRPQAKPPLPAKSLRAIFGRPTRRRNMTRSHRSSAMPSILWTDHG